MLSLKKIAKALRKGRESIEDLNLVLDESAAALEAGGQVARSTGQKLNGAVQLGQRLGQDFTRGVAELTKPAAVKVEATVVSVKPAPRPTR